MASKELRSLAARLSVTSYFDYKEYLRDLFRHTKERTEHYSYLQFSADLGLGENNTSHLILTTKRRINSGTAKKIAESLALTGLERRYFLKLVALGVTRSVEAREKTLQFLLKIKEKTLASDKERKGLSFFSDWHHALVFEALSLGEGGSTPLEIAHRLSIPLGLDEIHRSLNLLVELGLVERCAESTRHRKLVTDFSAGDEVGGLGIVAYHHKMLELAKEFINPDKASEVVDVSSVTLATSHENAVRIRTLIQEFRKYLMFIANSTPVREQVVQVNIQLFPLTK